MESVYLWTEIMWAFHRGAACWGLTNSSCRVSPGTPLSFPHTQLNLQDWPSTPLPAPQDLGTSGHPGALVLGGSCYLLRK